MLMRALVCLLALAAAVPMTGCTTNAATGRSQLVFMSREREIALGEESMPQLVASYGGEYGVARSRAYVSEIGDRMAALTEADYPTLPWEFTLLDSEVINAFALPGGKVFVSRGLVAHLENEAELAGVLGHEIGHVTAEHVDERISRQMLVAGAAIAAGVAAQESDEEWVRRATPIVVGVGASGYLLKFSRDQELEADQLGMRYASRAGYNPAGLVGVLEVLRDESGARGGAFAELFSTHPDPERRLERARRRLAEQYEGVGGELYRDRFMSNLSELVASTPAGGASQWCAVCAAQERSALAAAAAE